MLNPEITVAGPAERDKVVGSLVAAFADDPVLRYLFPDEQTYPAYAGGFFGFLFDIRVDRGTIWTIDGGAATAMWEAPDADEGSDADLAAVLPAPVLERVRSYNQEVHQIMPAKPYWYLGVLGTHPASAGRRWGHAVMAVGLKRAADDGLPAVLETATPGNVEMYRRAGWEVVASLDAPVPTWVMQQ